LQQAGTSYSELVDVVRQRYAARYLLDAGGSIEEVAQRLGFANPTAFFKAHKRWTGLTPREVRESRDVRLMGAAPLDELGEPAPRRTKASGD
jgi:AraC-like DNA-binding protein